MFDTGDKSVWDSYIICKLLNEPDQQFNFFKFKIFLSNQYKSNVSEVKDNQQTKLNVWPDKKVNN